ncbi:MAG: 3-isopropylmalate dehydratase [Peptococcaceae bacterium]|jgi:3-isopropylmalate/(R)-2-methylmalate dehydratase small subunit|nr:3-isopropylmalate dehydratase [Peptococcaceae bacterium]
MDWQRIEGRAHRFGDHINTDQISPAQFMELSNEEIAAHAMTGADADFPKKVRKGDIIVAGKNFGSGSSRETAPLAIKECGVSLVIAEFFARIFYRNCINIGLPALIVPDTSGIGDGDRLDVRLGEGIVLNLTTGGSRKCAPIPESIMELLNAGGLLQQMEQKLQRRVGL